MYAINKTSYLVISIEKTRLKVWLFLSTFISLTFHFPWMTLKVVNGGTQISFSQLLNPGNSYKWERVFSQIITPPRPSPVKQLIAWIFYLASSVDSFKKVSNCNVTQCNDNLRSGESLA